jgi:3-deoxy-7-phosphoheptulonate synthase
VILRGGREAPNYGAEAIAATLKLLGGVGLPERLVVDSSHDNSGKDHERQPQVAAEIAAQIAAGQEAIVGVMLESFLEGGRQELSGELVYGRSITDRCMDWESTVAVLRELDAAVLQRRA